MCWGRPESASQGRPLNVKLGRPLGVISEHQIGTSPGRPAGNDPVYGCENDRTTIKDEENPKIVPQTGETDKIVSFFYHTYNGEGARKMQHRIKRFYTGISIKRIQSNETVLKTISKSIQYSVTSLHFLL